MYLLAAAGSSANKVTIRALERQKKDLLFERDDVAVSGVDLRESEGQIVGLGARVDEEADRQLVRHRRDDPLGAEHDVVVQETVVGVQRLHLLVARFHHLRMAMPNCNFFCNK